MEKVYEALKWLKMAQAISRLQELTDTHITEELLIQFCQERKSPAYMDIYPPGVEGVISSTKQKVTLFGIHEILNPDMAFRDEDLTCTVIKYKDAHWIGLLPRNNRTALFKSTDIKKLAEIINAAGNGDDVDHDGMRQQLEQERNARQLAEQRADRAEAEIAELRPTLKAAEEKPSHILAVAALLRMLREPRQTGRNQSAVQNHILQHFKDWRGMSKRNLEIVFSEANKAAEKAAKETE